MLGDSRDLALLFKNLATLRTDARLFYDVDELRWRGPIPAFPAFVERLGDARLLERCSGLQQPISFEKEGNCFVGGSIQALDQLAETLCDQRTIGQLTKVCDRWIYSSCLCFALDLEEQERSQFRYRYSCFQLEYSHNLLFSRGTVLDVDTLPQPTHRGTRRLAGVDLQKPRIRAVAQAVLALAPQPGGFTTEELAAKIRPLLPQASGPYTARHAAYDLMKLRGKNLIERVDKTRRYRPSTNAICTLAGLLILRDKVIKPVLAGAANLASVARQKPSTPSINTTSTFNSKCAAPSKLS